MREIKFRVWDTYNKEMLELEELNYEYGEPAIRTTMYSDYFGPSDMILMQYVGLHDKNGKEIYEGDVVKIDCPTMKMTGEIKYSEMSAMFYIYDVIEDIEETLWYQKEEYEIIGNIYENPELLEHK